MYIWAKLLGVGGVRGRLGLCHGAWAVLSLTRYMGNQGILRSSHYLMDGLSFFRRFFAFAAKDTQILIHHIHNRFQPVPFHYISSINPLFLLS